MIQQEQSGAVMVHVQHRVEQEHKQEQEHYIVHITDKTAELQQVVKIVIHIHVVQVHMPEDGLVGEVVQYHVVQEHNQDTDIITLVTLVEHVPQNTDIKTVIPKDVVQVHTAAAGAAGAVALHRVAEEHNTAIKKDTQVTMEDGVGQNRPLNHVILIHAVQ